MGYQLYKKSLVNSDIKPENMMLDINENLFMIDTDTIRPEKLMFENDCATTSVYNPVIAPVKEI
jgi:serine/threonine protein kinase